MRVVDSLEHADVALLWTVVKNHAGGVLDHWIAGGGFNPSVGASAFCASRDARTAHTSIMIPATSHA